MCPQRETNTWIVAVGRLDENINPENVKLTILFRDAGSAYYFSVTLIVRQFLDCPGKDAGFNPACFVLKPGMLFWKPS